jgi:hypothetical protein
MYPLADKNIQSNSQVTVQFYNTPLNEITEEDCDLKRDSNSLVDCLHAQVITVTNTQSLQGRIPCRHKLDMILLVALLTRIKSSLVIYAACNFPHFSIKTIQKNMVQNSSKYHCRAFWNR